MLPSVGELDRYTGEHMWPPWPWQCVFVGANTRVRGHGGEWQGQPPPICRGG